MANIGATQGIIALTKTQTESGSDSANTTGTGKVGKTATGIVKATYLQATGTVNLPSGTTLTCSKLDDCGGKPLTYKTTDTYSLSFSAGTKDLAIQATDIGSEYNLPIGVKFKVSGIADADITVSNVAPFTGGESKDVKTVSQKDIDDLKSKLADTLKSSASSKIATALGQNIEILQDRIKVEIKSATTDKNVGDEADNINMNMEVNITATGYNKNSIRPEVEKNLKQEEKDNLQLDLTSIVIKQNVKTADDKTITMTLDITGMLIPIIDENKIKKDLVGKSLKEIEPYLKNIPNVGNISYTYQPSWAPDFLKHIPFGTNSINLEIKQIKEVQ
ncbi:MAG: baseplate J/gp47 family protein [bacterium]